ncbi:hypothetical protein CAUPRSCDRAFT_13302, partial [Caulochytrium protostelioides]
SRPSKGLSRPQTSEGDPENEGDAAARRHAEAAERQFDRLAREAEACLILRELVAQKRFGPLRRGARGAAPDRGACAVCQDPQDGGVPPAGNLSIDRLTSIARTSTAAVSEETALDRIPLGAGGRAGRHGGVAVRRWCAPAVRRGGARPHRPLGLPLRIRIGVGLSAVSVRGCGAGRGGRDGGGTADRALRDGVPADGAVGPVARADAGRAAAARSRPPRDGRAGGY